LVNKDVYVTKGHGHEDNIEHCTSIPANIYNLILPSRHSSN